MSSGLGRSATVHELRAFLLTAQLRSFTKAAAVLHLTQPGLSMAVRQLETKLGVTLFERSRRTVELTPAGLAIRPSVERLIDNFDRTIGGMIEVAQGRIGRVAIACPEGVAARLFAPMIERFVVAHPDVSVSLFDGDATSVARLMHASICDFGLTGFWEPHQDFHFEPIAADRCCVVCTREHPFAALASVRPELLGSFPMVALNRDAGIRGLLERETVKIGTAISIQFEVARISTLLEMVRSSGYFAVVTELSLPVRLEKELASIPVNGPNWCYPIGLITPVRRLLMPAAGAFVARLRAEWQPDTGAALTPR